MNYFAGIDVGASTTKAVVIDANKKRLGYAVTGSGADFEGAADRAYGDSLVKAGLAQSDEGFVLATGYGRRNVPFAGAAKTEISCHARGSYHDFPRAHTLIDIGGQDSKIIKVDDSGRRTSFKMNRKCAAGTGAFLEEIANRLEVPLDELDGLARAAGEEVQLGSYCTVFTATEILTRIREGVKVENLVRGVFGAVIKRAIEMDPLEGDIVMSGGVAAHNPFFVQMFGERLGKEIAMPPLPQFTGAFGAALYALEEKGGSNA